MTERQAVAFVFKTCYSHINTYTAADRIAVAREIEPDIAWRQVIIDAANTERRANEAGDDDRNAVDTLERHLAQEMLRWPS